MSTAANDSYAAIYDGLREILVEFDIPNDGISFDTELRADLDIDSAELVEIVAAATDGQVPEGKQLSAVTTIGQLVALLNQQNA